LDHKNAIKHENSGPPSLIFLQPQVPPSKEFENDCASMTLPCSSVKDVKVGITDGSPEGLVRKVGRPPGQGRHPPLEVAGRSVSPGARVAVQGTFGADERGLFRHGC
jgi:hypothetical protein